MNAREFNSTLAGDDPPRGVSRCLQALWHDAKGGWDHAHELVQDDESSCARWVHAYLHRKEGDLANARYWYTRAGKKMPSHDLAQEWNEIVNALLAEEPARG